MALSTYAVATTFVGTHLPKVGKSEVHRSVFGDLAIVVFLVAQCLDGIFTYVGVLRFGIGVEANPVIAGLMMYFGHGMALVSAKGVAGALGMGLHLRQIHAAVAVLACFYVAAAILPWAVLLFF